MGMRAFSGGLPPRLAASRIGRTRGKSARFVWHLMLQPLLWPPHKMRCCIISLLDFHAPGRTSRMNHHPKPRESRLLFLSLFNYFTTPGEFDNASNYGMILMPLVVMYCIIFNEKSEKLVSTQTELDTATAIQTGMVPPSRPQARRSSCTRAWTRQRRWAATSTTAS